MHIFFSLTCVLWVLEQVGGYGANPLPLLTVQTTNDALISHPSTPLMLHYRNTPAWSQKVKEPKEFKEVVIGSLNRISSKRQRSLSIKY